MQRNEGQSTDELTAAEHEGGADATGAAGTFEDGAGVPTVGEAPVPGWLIALGIGLAGWAAYYLVITISQ